MATVQRWAVLALVPLLAGCTDHSATVGAPQAATFGDDTGALKGRVVDPEFVPIPGAIVGIVQLGKQTTTDAAGSFILSDVPPGPHTVAAMRIGYETAIRSLDVVVGETLDVEFTLTALIVRTSYHTVWSDQGYFECSWQNPLGTGPCFFPGPQTQQPNNKRAWNYAVGAGLETLVNEITWTSNSLATGTSLRMTLSYANRTTAHWYCDAEGNNPLQLRWERTAGCVSGGDRLPDDEPQTIPPEGQELRTFVNSGEANPPLSVTGMGLTFQQSFEIATTEFFWASAPEDYSARS